jgi:hypothetical protein
MQVIGPDSSVPRLCIIAFSVENLHQGLIATLLDQLFGIQTRSGCSCAGAGVCIVYTVTVFADAGGVAGLYGHRLLGVDTKAVREVCVQRIDSAQCTHGCWERCCTWTRL